MELEQMGFEFDVEGLNVREMSMEEYANTMGPIWEMSYNHRTDADFYANLKKSIAVLGASYTGIAFAAGGSAAGVAKLSTGTDLVLDSADVVTSLITGDRAGAVVGAVSMVLPEVMEGVAKSGRGFFRSSGDILEGLEETERRTLLDALEEQGFVDVERIEINDDVLRITTKDGVGEISGVSELIEGGSDALQILSRQSVDDKLTRYLLNADHPVGGSKAKWFKEALGYTQSNIDDLAKQIIFDPTKAVQTGVTEYGTKFNQSISITGANGKVIDVTFAWMKSAEDDVVRLVTSIPTKK